MRRIGKVYRQNKKSNLFNHAMAKASVKLSSKAQSAMEYLMTYGWAILIIAVVLAALFELGVFKVSLPNECIASSGYYCQNPILSTTGVLNVSIGQGTGQTMYSTYVLFVPSGGSLSQAASTYIGTLQSGQVVSTNINLPTGSPYPSSYTLGTTLTGYLYLRYSPNQPYLAVAPLEKAKALKIYSLSPQNPSLYDIEYSSISNSNTYTVQIATVTATVNKVITTTSTTTSTSTSTTVTTINSFG